MQLCVGGGEGRRGVEREAQICVCARVYVCVCVVCVHHTHGVC